MIVYLLFFIVYSYLLINVFQNYHYEFKPLISFVFRKIFIITFPILIFFFSHFFLNYLVYLVIPFVIYLCYFATHKIKVPLRFTHRIIRMLITYILLVFIFDYFFLFSFVLLILPLILYVSNLFNKPLEKMIQKHFINNAKKKVENFKGVRVAITGSFGKTSTKHYLASFLKQKFIVRQTPKSYNTPLGIAKYVNNDDLDYADFLILEFGARRVGDIRELKKYYEYDIAIITGIGSMHIDTFKNIDNIIEEKMSLIEGSRISIVNYENDFIRNHRFKCSYSYGFNYGDYQARNVVISIYGSSFDLFRHNNFVQNIKIKPLGRGAVLNFLPLIIFADLYNISLDKLGDIKMVENRLSLRKMEGYYILDDAYNSNILGAIYALEVLSTHDGKKYLITPGFAEMNKVKEILSEEYSTNINKFCDVIILVKNNFTEILKERITREVIFVDSFKEGFNLFLKIKEENSILLIENDLLE